MYPFTKTKECPEITPKLDKNGRIFRPSPVDQFDGMEFMLGENGFKRSDISAYLHAESQKLKDAILARMEEIPSKEGYTPDTPVSEIIDDIIPRYCNTAASVVDFVSRIKDSTVGQVLKSENKETIKFEEKDVPSETE